MKLGIIREGKIPVDKRVALTPEQCVMVSEKFPSVEIFIQKSPLRCYKDSEYAALGFDVVEEVSDCDILMGIKEVPISDLLAKKTYLFFSHTIKKQAYNRDLLISILNNKIKLIDYETLTNSKKERVIAFGRYAGLVGAYNGIRVWGLRYNAFDLKPAHKCFDLEEMKKEFANVKLANIKIVLTGSGRVANGGMEVLEGMGIKKVSPNDLATKDFDYPVYAQLDMADYNKRKDGKRFKIQDFFENPNEYESTFERYTKTADVLIAGAYWDPKAPVLFKREDAKKDDFKIKVIADITCDIDGSIPSTRKPSSIDNPFYDYNVETEQVVPPFTSEKNISVMAVDNLPNELPRDASNAFGNMLIEHVLPELFEEVNTGMIERANITSEGKLTQYYQYLSDYVSGKD
ncbi:NAD(P)-dependent oxidoreductase [Chondrinema litorale]|uniref:NAD(P)-dependent oxidoreductase n=1 Tax=Chondrinema litorale TaxID=2994555 RepID=UPI0025439376|nr:NAD(P)-dependent oxidoreductase [Chondrinema litorale]UZR94904.1 NAD(P)-dependent oxidoreductase [Chondrinema litorale]